MTTRSQLMLLAATLVPLPLYAQEAAPQAPAAAVAPATAEIAPMSPLTLIPADVDIALVLPNIGERIASYLHLTEPKAVGSVAIASAKGNGTLAKDFYTVYGLASTFEIVLEGADEWANVAKEDLRAIIKDAGKGIHDANVKKCCDTISGMKLKPIYAVASIAPGHEEEVQQAIEHFKKDIAEDAADDDELEYVTFGDLCGLKFTHHADTDDSDAGEKDGKDVLGDAAEAELAKRSFYLLAGVMGNHVVGVVCEDPNDIAFAKSAEESVLSTKEWQAVKPHMKDDIIAAASMAPDVQNAGKSQTQAYVDLVDAVAGTFEKLAEKDSAAAESLKGAATGLHTIAAQVGGMMDSSAANKPMFFQVWGTPGAYHCELTYDAVGCSFEPWKLTLDTKAADPDTIFTCECTPFSWGSRAQMPDCKTLGEAGMAVFNGAVASLAPELQGLVAGQMQQVIGFLPEASAACNAIGTIKEGMGGSAGVVVDGKATAPAYLMDGEKSAMARVAIVSGVQDRAKLAQGWDGLLKVTGDILDKCGQDRAMLSMLPIVPATVVEGVMSYSVAIPGILTPDMGANVTVSDTLFAIGTSAKLNQEIVTTATGTQEFAGITFTLNTKPLAETARSIADAMLKAAGPIEKKRVYFDSFCEDVEDGEEEAGVQPHAEREFYEYEVPTSSQQSAVRARNIADGLEKVAKQVQSVKGTVTTKDDVVTLHVDVELTDKK